MKNLSVLRVETVQETLDLLAESNMQSKVLSGGVSIALQARNGNLNCDRLIDISRVEELRTILPVKVEGNPYLQIGAGLSLSHVTNDSQLIKKFPGFISVVKNCCDPARKNAFTLGGLLAVKRSTGNLFPALAVLEALVQVKHTGSEKLIPVMEWLSQVKKEPGWLITAVLIPDVPQSEWVVKEVKRRQMPGELIVGLVMSAIIQKNGSPSDLRLASVVDQFGVQRWTTLEEKINQNMAEEESFQAVLDELEIQLQMRWGDGLDAQYRRQVLRALISRGLNEMIGEEEVQA